MTLSRGDLATVQPADGDDPVAAHFAGETVRVMQVRADTTASPLVYCVLVEPIHGQSPRFVFRECDLIPMSRVTSKP